MSQHLKRNYYVKLQAIHVEAQYGSGYKAAILKDEKDDLSPKVPYLKVESLPGGKTLKKNVQVFVKCPDATLSATEQERFIDDEFMNGTSINHAAKRAKERRASSDKKTAPTFTISPMVGKGTLTHRQRATAPCLIYEFAEGEGLRDLMLSDAWQRKAKLNAKDFLEFFLSFAHVVRVLHNQGIVHTFLVPRHIICRNRNKGTPKLSPSLDGDFTLVGFGYARHIDTAGKKSPFQVAKEDQWFRAPECRENRSHTAFGYPADIYSIGAILYSLLLTANSAQSNKQNLSPVKTEILKKGMDVLKNPPTDARLLKEQIALYAKKSQEKLLQENENILKLIDSCLRHDAEQRYSCVEELIEAIEIAKNATGNNIRQPEKLSRKKFITDDVSQLSEGDPIKLGYFKKLKWAMADELKNRYGGLHRGHLEVYGHRDRIVTSLCRLLGSAVQGDTYRTMTLPDYWTDANLGSLGRFLTMNKHMARKGVKIERLFLVSHEFHELSEEMQVVLEDQLDAQRTLDEVAKKKFILKVLVVKEKDIANFERNGQLVAYLEEGDPEDNAPRSPEAEEEYKRCKIEKTICLNFFSTAQEVWSNGQVSVRRTIRKVRFWNPNKVQRAEQFSRSRNDFELNLDTARLLKDFIFAPGQPQFPGRIQVATLIGSEEIQQTPRTIVP